VTGTVTFFVCNPGQVSGGTCATGGSQVGSPVNLNPTAGSNPPSSTADSAAVTANQLGTWCFRGVYTPGGANGSSDTGSAVASPGECFTVTDTSSATSAQTWVPNDTATVTSAHGAPMNGSLSIALHESADCSGPAVAGQTYTFPVSGTSSSTQTTSNTTYSVS